MISVMKRILLWTWCLPQTALGALMAWIHAEKSMEIQSRSPYAEGWLFEDHDWFSGASLGKYILLRPWQIVQHDTLWHEFGHCRQSLYLGPLYLLVVGIPSVVRNLWARVLVRRGMPPYQVGLWYYGGYPERWADRLGGVE
jgi:hypothetical protein